MTLLGWEWESAAAPATTGAKVAVREPAADSQRASVLLLLGTHDVRFVQNLHGHHAPRALVADELYAAKGALAQRLDHLEIVQANGLVVSREQLGALATRIA